MPVTDGINLHQISFDPIDETPLTGVLLTGLIKAPLSCVKK
jgi:hypothetical protein